MTPVVRAVAVYTKKMWAPVCFQPHLQTEVINNLSNVKDAHNYATIKP